MAAQTVKSVFYSILTDPDHCEQSKTAKDQSRIFLHAIEDSECARSFDQFCETLTKAIETSLFACVSSNGTCRSKGVQREKI